MAQAAQATAQQANAALEACEKERNRLAHSNAALQRHLNEQQVTAEELRQQARAKNIVPSSACRELFHENVSMPRRSTTGRRMSKQRGHELLGLETSMRLKPVCDVARCSSMSSTRLPSRAHCLSGMRRWRHTRRCVGGSRSCEARSAPVFALEADHNPHWVCPRSYVYWSSSIPAAGARQHMHEGVAALNFGNMARAHRRQLAVVTDQQEQLVGKHPDRAA